MSKEFEMAVHKVIEILAESKKSWEDATQIAVKEASKTVKNIKSVWIKDMSCAVSKTGKITSYRANVKITFGVGK